MDELHSRQPLPVKVIITGHPIDVHYWMQAFKRQAESAGDLTQDDSATANSFKIYPRAVND